MIAIELGGFALILVLALLFILHLDAIALVAKFIWTFIQLRVEAARAILGGKREDYDEVSDLND
jgi:hypothetical protein